MNKFLSFLLTLFLTINLNAASGKIAEGVPTHFAQIEPTDKKSRLYPNPAREFTVVQNTSNLKISNISVLSMVGSMVISKNITDNNKEQQINLNKLPAGRYFVKVAFSNGLQEVLSLIKL